jgi:hypothetical protein
MVMPQIFSSDESERDSDWDLNLGKVGLSYKDRFVQSKFTHRIDLMKLSTTKLQHFSDHRTG